MAGKGAAGCGGWIVAPLLLVALVSQCGKEPTGGVDGDSSTFASTGRKAWMYIQPASANCRSGPSTNESALARLE
ncbi:MAG: hypothetical protein ACK4VY_09775 [Brevundimonas sp.]